MRKHPPRIRVLKRIAAPTAIPAIAAPDSLMPEDSLLAGAALLLVAEAAGIALVGVRAKGVAFCPKYTCRSGFAKPLSGVLSVAPPVGLLMSANSTKNYKV
jgi:hypothetical protein